MLSNANNFATLHDLYTFDDKLALRRVTGDDTAPEPGHFSTASLFYTG